MSIARFNCRKCGRSIYRREAVMDGEIKILVCKECYDPPNKMEGLRFPSYSDPKTVHGAQSFPVDVPTTTYPNSGYDFRTGYNPR